MDTNRQPAPFPRTPRFDALLRRDRILCEEPFCPNLRWLGTRCHTHQIERAQAIVGAGPREEHPGVCKGCDGPVGVFSTDRDDRYCLRCWEEAEALHQMTCDAALRQEARERAGRNGVRWWETPRMVAWGYAALMLAMAAFVWRVVG